MSRDKSVRNLSALQRTASTSRVLNLSAVGLEHGEDREYLAKPFFVNRGLNVSLILKHRLRPEEMQSLEGVNPNATKVILPFERSDLRLGGRSIMVGQRGWIDLLREACEDTRQFDRDIALLEALDDLPSLDPFLTREHLKRLGFDIAHCYFAISAADVAQMQRFVSMDIRRLIDLAFKNNSAGSAYTAKMAEALLSNDLDERLEPLRQTLRLEGEEYREGIFCWKGFLYYKWCLARLWPELKKVTDDLIAVKVTECRERDLLALIETQKMRLARSIDIEKKAVLKLLRVYDVAFGQLTEHNNPLAFREFLLNAPDLFLALGDRIGVISHIASFWKFRFPSGKVLAAPAVELQDILREFEQGIAAKLKV